MDVVSAGGSTQVTKSSYTVQNRSVGDLVQDRVLPRQVSTGSTRGTQTVGYGNTKIDGANNRISLEANNTKLLIGDTSDADESTGLSLVDSTTNQSVVLLGRTQGTTSTNGLTVFDSTGTRRLLAGTYPDGSIKIKLSQSGRDVATATDDQLIWSSDFNMLKIVQTGTLNLNITHAGNIVSAGTQTATLTHSLGYKPVVLAYATLPDANALAENLVLLPHIVFNNAGPLDGTFSSHTYYDIGTSTITFYVIHNVNTDYSPLTPAWNVKYYLMRETAA